MIYLIYKIHCNITDEDYYGSTKNLSHRISAHKTDTVKQNSKRVCKAKVIINRNDYTISVLETLEVNSKKEAFWLERHYIENYPCVNEGIPIKTDEEKAAVKSTYAIANKEYLDMKKAEYRKTNAKELSDKQCERYYANRDEINSKRREAKCRCDVCGIDINKAHKSRHEKTKTHIANALK